jgi:hypothetical protein
MTQRCDLISSFCFLTILYASATANIQIPKNVKNPIMRAIKQKLNPNAAIIASPRNISPA